MIAATGNESPSPLSDNISTDLRMLAVTDYGDEGIIERRDEKGKEDKSTGGNDTLVSIFKEIGPLFSESIRETVSKGGLPALYTGAIPRVLFFIPAATIFFVCYESFFELISLARDGKAFWQ